MSKCIGLKKQIHRDFLQNRLLTKWQMVQKIRKSDKSLFFTEKVAVTIFKVHSNTYESLPVIGRLYFVANPTY